ncbi:GNAT family N-acetyltransferase [Allosphingosinicella indica]|uniref:PhnO protein n=1 Tax=Allosphingosinicella indica TaxID=941907 RepID=A0A1X7GDX8_9SPHN|nr:GNAT family N-acetyltransferase [Allosphingosinicella indica]SMF68341.1 PhnO protein [Allosphingosinicella indica]
MSGEGAALAIRAATRADAPAIAALIDGLGYAADAEVVTARMLAVREARQHVLVAADGAVIGVLTTSVMHVLHRPKPVGRISMLVVSPERRGSGIGAALVAEAERLLAAEGCGLVEVTSNRRRVEAHRFYERLGYEHTSHRFGKTLTP